ncbi:MAG: hypothetical protein ACFFAQ_13400 [Promethearchaeota archaeon]
MKNDDKDIKDIEDRIKILETAVTRNFRLINIFQWLLIFIVIMIIISFLMIIQMYF